MSTERLQIKLGFKLLNKNNDLHSVEVLKLKIFYLLNSN